MSKRKRRCEEFVSPGFYICCLVPQQRTINGYFPIDIQWGDLDACCTLRAAPGTRGSRRQGFLLIRRRQPVTNSGQSVWKKKNWFRTLRNCGRPLHDAGDRTSRWTCHANEDELCDMDC